MLDPRAFLINNRTGRVVAATFIEFLSGTSTTPSICFTDSPDSGLQCDNAGAVNYIKNGTNLGELGTASNLIGGSDTQIQFNNSGSFDGSVDLTWDDTGKELSVGGDIKLDDGGAFSTTLQIVTPTANRTISFPDTTGTVVTTGDNGTVTSTMIVDGTIVDADVNASAAIALSKLATGALPTAITVASANIVNGTIVDADVNASAAIAGTKINPDFGAQNIETTGDLDINTGLFKVTSGSSAIGFFSATPATQPSAIADITSTATSGVLPTPDGSITIADATTPTVTELLEYCVELEAKLEAALGHLRTLGLIAT